VGLRTTIGSREVRCWSGIILECRITVDTERYRDEGNEL